MINFGNFFEGLSKVRNFDQFVEFFSSQPTDLQVLMGIAIFGIGILVWIFFWAFFIDK